MSLEGICPRLVGKHILMLHTGSQVHTCTCYVFITELNVYMYLNCKIWTDEKKLNYPYWIINWLYCSTNRMISRLKITHSLCQVANSSFALTVHKIKWIHAGTVIFTSMLLHKQSSVKHLTCLYIVSHNRQCYPVYFFFILLEGFICSFLRDILEKARYNNEDRWNLQNSSWGEWGHLVL